MSDVLDPLEPSPYKTLSVPKDATLPTIRGAYRKLVLSCHPDKVQDEIAKKIKAEEFHLVQQAYEILSDETRRRRWDERSKLAELRAEMAEERAVPRKAQDYGAARTGQSPIFEMRGSRMYEERVPKTASRAYEEDPFSTNFAADSRSRKYENDRYFEASPRKTSGRVPDDRRKSREAEILREKRAREQEAIARDRDLRNRKRDKDRKRDKEAKFENRNRAYVESDDSGSESDDRRHSSKFDSRSKRKDDDRNKTRDEPPRRSSKKEVRDYDDELDGKINRIQDYMFKARETIEPERERRPARRRADSYRDRIPQSRSPEPISVDTGRRSSGDDARRSSGRTRGSRPPSPVRKGSGKDKRMPDVVDSPSMRKVAMESSSSDPRGLRNMTSSKSKIDRDRREPHRAATSETSPKFEHPGMRRSETVPINQMRRSEMPFKSSNLKNMAAPSDISSSDSSDSSDSDANPNIKTVHPSPPRATKIFKIERNDSDDHAPHTVYREPESYVTRTRDVSPKINPRRSSDRPPMTARSSTNARAPPPRAASYASPPTASDDRPTMRSRTESSRNPPPLKTHSSARPSGGGATQPLFGEYMQEEYSPKSYHGGSPKTHESERYGNGKSYSRRGSEDVGLDRDAYPGSLHKNHRRPQHDRAGSEVY